MRVRKGGDNGGVWTNRRGAGKEDNATSTNQNTGPDKPLVRGALGKMLVVIFFLLFLNPQQKVV